MPIYSNDPKLKAQAKRLRALRESAGLEQKDLAARLGTSTKRISNIENCHKEAIENLKQKEFVAWWNICRAKADEGERNAFKESVIKLFKF